MSNQHLKTGSGSGSGSGEKCFKSGKCYSCGSAILKCMFGGRGGGGSGIGWFVVVVAGMVRYYWWSWHIGGSGDGFSLSGHPKPKISLFIWLV